MKESQKDLIERARKFAIERHNGQKDDSGIDYFEAHVEVVAELISIVTDDPNIIAAALLHDVVEDTNTTEVEVKNEFGEIVSNLVMEVTHEGKKESGGYYFPRLKTQQGMMIKFADRLSNISRLEPWSQKRRAQYLKRSKFWRSDLTEKM